MRYRNVSGVTLLVPGLPAWEPDEEREVSVEVNNVHLRPVEEPAREPDEEKKEN